MPVIRFTIGAFLILITVVLGAASSVVAQPRLVSEIAAEPVPGQLDVLQGTAIQLGGRMQQDGLPPTAYAWKIAQGQGGKLYDADKATAIFQAPLIEMDMELFVIELTAEYGAKPPAHARLHVRVHKNEPEPEAKTEDSDDPTAFIDEYYRKSKAKEQQKSSRQRDIIVHAPQTYPGWHWGFNWGWGGFVNYPMFVPVMLPAPGDVLEPGRGNWADPAPIPYDEIVTSFPETVAERYVPQDFPMRDMPDVAGSLEYRPDLGDMSMSEAHSEAMIDPHFGVDPIGW